MRWLKVEMINVAIPNVMPVVMSHLFTVLKKKYSTLDETPIKEFCCM
jgi:hypothetical protein